MKFVRTVVFTPEEAQTFAKAQRLIDIAYPLATDPLVQRSEDAKARAVQADHQHRTAMRALTQPYDLVTRPRLLLAQRALTTLLDRVVTESTADHWLGLASDPTVDQARQMADVLAAERTGQQRLVRDALALVEEALAPLVATDDPTLLRSQRYEDV